MLEFVGDAPVHRRSGKEPGIAAAWTPLQQAELTQARSPREGIDRDLQRRDRACVIMRDVARLAALHEHVAHALDLRLNRGSARTIEGAGHVPGAEAVTLTQSLP